MKSTNHLQVLDIIGFAVFALIILAVKFKAETILCRDVGYTHVLHGVEFSPRQRTLNMNNDVLWSLLNINDSNIVSKTRTTKMSTGRFLQVFLIKCLLLSGDIHCNPGPIRNRCGVDTCGKPVKCNQRRLNCSSCLLWFHVKCLNLSDEEYQVKSNIYWNCDSCNLPAPSIYPCGAWDCGVLVKDDNRGIQCDICDLWYHAECIDMTTDEYNFLSQSEVGWNCTSCSLP